MAVERLTSALLMVSSLASAEILILFGCERVLQAPWFCFLFDISISLAMAMQHPLIEPSYRAFGLVSWLLFHSSLVHQEKGPFGMPRCIGSEKNPWRLKWITRCTSLSVARTPTLTSRISYTFTEES